MIPLLLLGSTWMLIKEFEENGELRAAAGRSYDTRHALQDLLILHLDLETSERGFVIAENDSFLTPYLHAERTLAGAFDRIEAMAGDDLVLRAQLRALEAESNAKREFVASTVELARAGRAEEARRQIASGRGKAIMDRIRGLAAGIDAVEAAQLAQRLAEAEDDRVRLSRTTIILQVGLLLCLLFAALIALRINRARGWALAEARDSHARQAAIFDSATDGMLLLDSKGRITNLNPAAAAMYGHAPDAIRGQSVATLYADTPPPERVEGFLRAVADNRGGARLAQDFVGRRGDGSVFPTEVTVGVVADQEEQTYIAVARDVTERKQVERMKSEFVSIVSHELRTPLTSIAGSLGLLAGGAAGALPDRAAKLVDIAQSNSARLVRLINDILDIEKMEAGKMAFDIRPLPLASLIEQCVQANAAFAAGHGVSILTDPVPHDLQVLADEDRLTQVVTNLLSNAAKFSPKDGQVRVTVTPGPLMHRISIADRGPGIPAEFRDRIFQKFAQADASDTRQKGGTGLGLSIVSEIVSRLKGRVSFDSEPGRGATFHVDLPAVLPEKA